MAKRGKKWKKNIKLNATLVFNYFSAVAFRRDTQNETVGNVGKSYLKDMSWDGWVNATQRSSCAEFFAVFVIVSFPCSSFTMQRFFVTKVCQALFSYLKMLSRVS